MVDNNQSPIFVGGTGRSGSTIVGHLLDHHPRVTLTRPMEVRFITGNDGFIDALVKADSKRAKKAAELAVDRLLNRWFERAENVGLHTSMSREFVENAATAYLAEFHAHPQQTTQSLVFALMEQVAQGCGAHRWVDTTPANARKADRLELIYPHSRVIVVTRDGRDVAASFVHQNFGPSDVFAAIELWESRMIKSHNAALKASPGHVLTIELFDLVEANRDLTVNRILDHLDLEPSSEMLEWFNSTVTTQGSHAGRWRRDFDDRTAAAIDECYAAACERLKAQGIEIPASGE